MIIPTPASSYFPFTASPSGKKAILDPLWEQVLGLFNRKMILHNILQFYFYYEMCHFTSRIIEYSFFLFCNVERVESSGYIAIIVHISQVVR